MQKNSKYPFADMNIVVTGAGGGIGQDLVRAMSSLGATIWACDLKKSSMVSLKNLTNVKICELDVRVESSWMKLLKEFSSSKNRILNGLVQSAGVLKPGYIANIDTKDIDYHIDINVKGLILGSTLASRIMKQQKSGHIVNIASLAGLAPIPGIALYSTSKFAVRGFSLALAQEMKEFDVSVTVVCPDAVKTSMLDNQVGYEETALTFSGTQLEPRDVTSAIIESFGNKKLEIILPFHRGVLGKIGNSFPGLSSFLIKKLKEKGMRKQMEFQKAKD
ncbi:SDR family NAD(P)-dependent oxidoreductase [Leptospira sp. GIMC2001]|uniref:SDR family NAD(P)-dependent oxidoreductase n=1 Tax=Leptospira sp. GIMC2001 TaxID=1513297 RepID=UPI0023494FF2|nr:SDR family oxidoreductase [Leptospira sp. GIMC2001]WCL50523.1 SDR family NAD(P)-dependent oxidoreductase [Leptospira sp. GIMC2001]